MYLVLGRDRLRVHACRTIPQPGPNHPWHLMMEVCVLDLNGPYGPLASYSELIEPLEERGVRITFLVPERRAASVADRIRGASVITFGGNGTSSIRMTRAMLELDSDIFHANSTSAIGPAAVAAACRRRPLVAHLRNSLLSRREQLVIASAHRVPSRTAFVAVSELAGEVSGLPRRDWEVINDPVSVGRTRSEESPTGPFIVGAVANQTPTKGLDVLRRVAAGSAGMDCRFRVFGSAADVDSNEFVAEQHAALERSGLGDRVEFCGVVEDLAAQLPQLDAMLITSRRESFSRVAAECMIAGVPLLAPDIPGLNETVGDGLYAARYGVADAGSAIAALSEVIQNYDAALAMASRAKTWASEQFSPPAVANRIYQLYRTMASV